jgi:hypothetical protein
LSLTRPGRPAGTAGPPDYLFARQSIRVTANDQMPPQGPNWRNSGSLGEIARLQWEPEKSKRRAGIWMKISGADIGSS